MTESLSIVVGPHLVQKPYVQVKDAPGVPTVGPPRVPLELVVACAPRNAVACIPAFQLLPLKMLRALFTSPRSNGPPFAAFPSVATPAPGSIQKAFDAGMYDNERAGPIPATIGTTGIMGSVKDTDQGTLFR